MTIKRVKELSQEAGFDTSVLDIAHMIATAMRPLCDQAIDSGCGCGGADLWMTINGVEYSITVQKSKGQLLKERKNGE